VGATTGPVTISAYRADSETSDRVSTATGDRGSRSTGGTTPARSGSGRNLADIALNP
jgi:hypothetical protein